MTTRLELTRTFEGADFRVVRTRMIEVDDHGLNSARTYDTSLGRLGIEFGFGNNGHNREVIVDFTHSKALRGITDLQKRRVSVPHIGMGSQSVAKGVTLSVSTDAFLWSRRR